MSTERFRENAVRLAQRRKPYELVGSSLNDLPAYRDYSMKGRTYRYFKGKVQYPFGFGMSYSSFDYSWAGKPAIVKDSIAFSINIKNTGNYNADEVVQVYVHYPEAADMPVKELKAFKRVSLDQKNESTVFFSIPLTELQKWDMQKNEWKLNKGRYAIVAGSNSADERLISYIVLQ